MSLSFFTAILAFLSYPFFVIFVHVFFKSEISWTTARSGPSVENDVHYDRRGRYTEMEIDYEERLYVPSLSKDLKIFRKSLEVILVFPWNEVTKGFAPLCDAIFLNLAKMNCKHCWSMSLEAFE